MTLEGPRSEESGEYADRCPNCGLTITADGPCPRCGLPLSGREKPAQAQPAAPKAPAVSPTAARARIMVNVVILALGVYWVVTAGRQFGGARSSGPGGVSLVLFGVAVVSLIVGAYTAAVAWSMFRSATGTRRWWSRSMRRWECWL